MILKALWCTPSKITRTRECVDDNSEKKPQPRKLFSKSFEKRLPTQAPCLNDIRGQKQLRTWQDFWVIGNERFCFSPPTSSVTLMKTNCQKD